MSSFFQTLPETIQQPATLAMLGSIGAHLLFFATLPAFTSSVEPRPDLEVRRVRLLEPTQGSGSSQIASSRLGLPPVPNTPNSKVQIPPIGQTTSPVPNPLYTIPQLTPVPAPSQTQISSQERFNDLLRRLASRSQQPTTIRIPKPPTVQPDSKTQPDPKTNPTRTIDPSELTLKQADPSEVVRSLPLPPATEPTPSAQSSPTSPTTEPNTAPNTTPNTEPNPAPTPSAAQAAAQARNERLLAATRYNPDGVAESAESKLKLYQSFVQSVEQKGIKVDWGKDYIRVRQLQDPELKKPIPERPFPAALILNHYQQHPVAVAVLVGKDGKPLPNTKPTLLGSTGYQILNDQAIELIQQEANQPNQFPAIAEDKVRVFVYEFQFKAPSESAPVS
ncbi:MAG TPA: hypothetical protein VL134_12990 [Leptolyngbya sp.]|jgi:hypothetical protein|nr:hypothetical protein [Leptolyngbya sp.]